MTSICNSFLWRRKFALIIVTVITANVYTTHGQSYLFAIGQNSHVGYFERDSLRDPFIKQNSTATFNKQNFIKSDLLVGQQEEEEDNNDDDDNDNFDDDNNSTIIVIKSSLHSNTTELSQTAMDVITIIWYVATFLALAAFFLLMACSDRRCNARQRAAAAAAAAMRNNNNEARISPPTPSPSYSEFAPPSYESVMKLQNSQGIYVIPFPLEEEKEQDNSNQIGNGGLDGQQPTSPTPPSTVVTFYTINELQKLGS